MSGAGLEALGLELTRRVTVVVARTAPFALVFVLSLPTYAKVEKPPRSTFVMGEKLK